MPREIVDIGLRAAEPAGRIPGNADRAEFAGKSVIDQKPPGEGIAQVQQLLEGLGRLQSPDTAGQRAEDARLLAARHEILRRRLGKEAAITGVGGAQMRLENGELRIEAQE